MASGMSSFDYLHDAPPEVVVWLHAVLRERQVRSLGLFLAASLTVVFFAWALETARLHDAQRALAHAREHLERIGVEAARVKAELLVLHRAAMLERRLYLVRTSGTRTANRVAQLALVLPMSSWLTQVQLASGSSTMNGRAIGLESVGEVLASIPSRLADVHASGSRNDRVVDFQVELAPR
jgi:hypothetical protein